MDAHFAGSATQTIVVLRSEPILSVKLDFASFILVVCPNTSMFHTKTMLRMFKMLRQEYSATQ